MVRLVAGQVAVMQAGKVVGPGGRGREFYMTRSRIAPECCYTDGQDCSAPSFAAAKPTDRGHMNNVITLADKHEAQSGRDEAAVIGLRLYKVRMPWPLEPQGIRAFSQGLQEVLIVEERREIVENQIKQQLFNWRADVRPRVVGKFDDKDRPFLPHAAGLTVSMVARAIADRLLPQALPAGLADSIRAKLHRLERLEQAAATHLPPVLRQPLYCAGCPHNTSTQVPEGSKAMAGIGWPCSLPDEICGFGPVKAEAMARAAALRVWLLERLAGMFNAAMNFGLGPDLDALRAMVHSWAQSRIRPMACEIGRANLFPAALWGEMGALGLLGITVPVEYGGAGMGYLAHVVAVEEIARASASVSLSYGAHSNLCVNQINLDGSASQKARYLAKLLSGTHVGALAMSEAAAGSDVVSMVLRAERRGDHYVLNGTKYRITNGSSADVLVVYGKTDPAAGSNCITAFLIVRGMKGFTSGPHFDKLGMRGSDTAELIFNDVEVPVENVLGQDGRGVPVQMSDAAQVLAGITRAPGVFYGALTPNLRGFAQAMAAGADEVAVFASASEGFSRAIINCSIAASLARFAPVLAAAAAAKLRVRGYVSCVTHCPYDGPTPPERVARVAQALLALGCHAVSLGDTIGHATPETTARMLGFVLACVPARQLAGHFHDSKGQALANIAVSLEHGLGCFDAAVGGLGGCPFAPGAKGNVATEALVAHLHHLGFATGIDMARLMLAVSLAKGLRRI